jgi:hypothetical protein
MYHRPHPYISNGVNHASCIKKGYAVWPARYFLMWGAGLEKKLLGRDYEGTMKGLNNVTILVQGLPRNCPGTA